MGNINALGEYVQKWNKIYKNLSEQEYSHVNDLIIDIIVSGDTNTYSGKIRQEYNKTAIIAIKDIINFEYFEYIVVLNLCDRYYIREIDDSIGLLCNLRVLNIENMYIDTLPSLPANLKEFYCYNCKFVKSFTNLPAGLDTFGCSDFKHLRLYDLPYLLKHLIIKDNGCRVDYIVDKLLLPSYDKLLSPPYDKLLLPPYIESITCSYIFYKYTNLINIPSNVKIINIMGEFGRIPPPYSNLSLCKICPIKIGQGAEEFKGYFHGINHNHDHICFNINKDCIRCFGYV
jgi:hypothetical protein